MVTEQQPGTSELARTVRALRRRWWMVPMCWVIVVGTAVAYSVTAEKQYSATPDGHSVIRASTRSCSGRPSSRRTVIPPARRRRTSSSSRSTSWPRARRAVPRPDGYGDVERIKAAAEGQSDVVSVTATDPDPVRARRLANTFAQQYIEFRRDSDRAKIREAQALVQQRISTLTPQQRLNPEGRSLSERADQLQVLASLQTGNAELVQLAQTPTSPSSPEVGAQPVTRRHSRSPARCRRRAPRPPPRPPPTRARGARGGVRPAGDRGDPAERGVRPRQDAHRPRRDRHRPR